MTFFDIILYFVGTFLASLAASGLLLLSLKKIGIVDTPNERSSHATPIPRGGGVAVILVILIAWGIIQHEGFVTYQWIITGTLILGIVSLIDDLKSLSAIIRLFSQFFAVGGVFFLTTPSTQYFLGLFPFWLDNTLAIILWVWFINLFNFMDGIDGISSVESSSIGLGIFFLTLFGSSSIDTGILGLLIAAASLGFLCWNWHPAKLFLGDVGSIPLGFLLGWLLLQTLASPLWPAAIILPLYYLADATITLILRIWRGKNPWQAHREHFYQIATKKRFSHSQVSSIIAGTNFALIGLSIFSIFQPWLALLAAFVIVIFLLILLRGPTETTLL